MNVESIMAAIAFLQKAQNANALKDMTTVQKMMMKSVTETLSDQAHNILCDERGKERTNEAVIGHILDEAVLAVPIRDCHEKIDETSTNVQETSTSTSGNTNNATSKGGTAVSEEAQGLKSDKISKKNEDVTLSETTTSTSKDSRKSPELIDILNDIQNVRIPIAEVSVETSTDTTSPTKRASNRAKIAKEKEETLRMYEESSKKCEAKIDAIIGELDGTAKSTTTDTNTGSSTDTVWIRTKK